MIKDKFKKNSELLLNKIYDNNNNLSIKFIQGPLPIPPRKFQCICQYC